VTDPLSPERRSALMSRIQGGWRRNGLERAVHEWLVARRVNHRMNPRRTPGHPDVAIYGRDGSRLYLFIDGCFWHACPIHFRPPKNPRPSWNHDLVEEEMARSRRRAQLPYRWLQLWEHDVKSGAFESVLAGALPP